jgi:hypothetical protein
MPNQVIIIAGPGGTAFNNTHIERLAAAMRCAGAEVSVIGDGDTTLRNVAIMQSLDNAAILSNEPVTLFIMAHGTLDGDTHSLVFDESDEISSADFFNVASGSFVDRTIDIFMTSCHGGAAILHVDNLPAGSSLVTLSSGSETVSGYDPERLIPNITAGDFSARHLLDLYLGKALETRSQPSIAVSGQGMRDLYQELETRLGKDFSATEKDSIHTALDTVIGLERVDSIMKKISTAKGKGDLPLALDIGAAMAVTLAASPEMQDLSKYDPHKDSSGGQRPFERSTRFERASGVLPRMNLLDEFNIPRPAKNETLLKASDLPKKSEFPERKKAAFPERKKDGRIMGELSLDGFKK